MRSIALAVALAALPSLAIAQTYPPTPPSQSYRSTALAPHGYQNPAPPGYESRAQSAMNQPNPENCGTPDEPKACPPLPRHPLAYYPPNRQ